MRKHRLRHPAVPVLGVLLASGLALAASGAQAAPMGTPGYTVGLFAAAPSGSSAPDSIATVGNDVFIGYGNGGDPTGAGATSTIAEYSRAGTLLGTTSIAGHNDGLRYDAATGQLWSIQNEDANPNLVLINPSNLSKSAPLAFSATPHGGGYDDVAFGPTGTFVSASNPAGPPFTNPALVSASIGAGGVNVAGVLNGNATVTSINTGKPVTLALSDPDSLVFAPNGQLVLDSQGDAQLVFITNPGLTGQTASVLNLSNQVDDTVFGSGGTQTLLVSVKGLNAVYAVTGNFAAGVGYSAAASNGTTAGQDFVGQLDASTGNLTPIVTGLTGPGGEAFLPAAAVPEPASLALLGGGVLGLLGLSRRRRTA